MSVALDPEKLRSGVVECVAQSLAIEPGKIQVHSRLIPDLGADSLDFMDIMFALERRFDIKLQKEDFDLLARVKMSKEEAIVEGKLTPPALVRLRKWLPAMPVEGEVQPKELGTFITIETLMIIVESFVSPKPGTA